MIGSDLPVVDLKVFERTAAFLSPDAVMSYMRTIVELGSSLLQRLRAPDVVMLSAAELADAAHTLAGSAGMFGFERLATLGRRFERAVLSGSSEAPAVGDGLGAALEDTLHAIHERFLVGVRRN